MQSNPSNSTEAVLRTPPESTRTGILGWLRTNRTRLLKFASVGASGVLVNLLVFELCFRLLLPSALSGDPRFTTANAAGLLISIFTNFILNDLWTWGDRQKGTRRDTLIRLGKYYVTASAAGLAQLAVAWLSFRLLWSHIELIAFEINLSPSISVITGIGVAMFLNFAASHLWAFRDIDSE